MQKLLRPLKIFNSYRIRRCRSSSSVLGQGLLEKVKDLGLCCTRWLIQLTYRSGLVLQKVVDVVNLKVWVGVVQGG